MKLGSASTEIECQGLLLPLVSALFSCFNGKAFDTNKQIAPGDILAALYLNNYKRSPDTAAGAWVKQTLEQLCEHAGVVSYDELVQKDFENLKITSTDGVTKEASEAVGEELKKFLKDQMLAVRVAWKGNEEGTVNLKEEGESILSELPEYLALITANDNVGKFADPVASETAGAVAARTDEILSIDTVDGNMQSRIDKLHYWFRHAVTVSLLAHFVVASRHTPAGNSLVDTWIVDEASRRIESRTPEGICSALERDWLVARSIFGHRIRHIDIQRLRSLNEIVNTEMGQIEADFNALVEWDKLERAEDQPKEGVDKLEGAVGKLVQKNFADIVTLARKMSGDKEMVKHLLVLATRSAIERTFPLYFL